MKSSRQDITSQFNCGSGFPAANRFNAGGADRGWKAAPTIKYRASCISACERMTSRYYSKFLKKILSHILGERPYSPRLIKNKFLRGSSTGGVMTVT